MSGYLFYFNYYKYNTVLFFVKLYLKTFKKFVVCFTRRSKTADFPPYQGFLSPKSGFGVLTGKSVSIIVPADCIVWQTGK